MRTYENVRKPCRSRTQGQGMNLLGLEESDTGGWWGILRQDQQRVRRTTLLAGQPPLGADVRQALTENPHRLEDG